jgi:hypothetical protein
MKLRSRKRPASAIFEPHASGHKRRRNAAREQKSIVSRLVKLPCEIRMMILGHLLLSPSPLNGLSKLDLHPAILRTCKTFAEDHERTPLLYKNEFLLALHVTRWDDYALFVNYNLLTASGIGSTLARIPQTLLRRVENINVQILIDYYDSTGPHTQDESSDVRGSVAMVVDPLKGFKGLKNLKINIINNNPLAEDNPYGNDILEPLQELRKLKSVSIAGTSPEYARTLKTVLMSCGPSENLSAMGDGLRTYLGNEFYEVEGWGEISDALATYDVRSFIAEREIIVQRTEAERTAALVLLYQHDSADTIEEVERHGWEAAQRLRDV